MVLAWQQRGVTVGAKSEGALVHIRVARVARPPRGAAAREPNQLIDARAAIQARGVVGGTSVHLGVALLAREALGASAREGVETVGTLAPIEAGHALALVRLGLAGIALPSACFLFLIMREGFWRVLSRSN